MILIIIRAVKVSDLRLDDIPRDGRIMVERLKKEVLDLRGMHRDGNYFYHKDWDNLKEIIERTYVKKVSVKLNLLVQFAKHFSKQADTLSACVKYLH